LPKTLSTLNILGNPLVDYPTSLTMVSGHEIKIIGLERTGTQIRRHRAASPDHAPTSALSGGDTLNVDVFQDTTGLMFAGLADDSASSHGPAEPAVVQMPEESTDPAGTLPQKRR
jgi:hypothetical protein